MIGAIIINGYASYPSIINQANNLVSSFKNRSIEVDIIKSTTIKYIIGEDIIFYNMKNYDFIIYLDKDKVLSYALKKAGYRLFNSPEAIEICDDKLLTHLILASHNIPMPKTIQSPLCYIKDSKLDEDLINHIESTLKYPLIVKECFGSLGKNVYLVSNHDELINLTNSLINVPLLFQEYIEESKGLDIRVIVIGNKVVSSMKRYNKDSFKSNIGSGGVGSSYILSKDQIKLCEEVSKIINLDFCGIDLLLGKDKTYVCEVNSNAFTTEIDKVNNINIEDIYAEYIIRKVSHE